MADEKVRADEYRPTGPCLNCGQYTATTTHHKYVCYTCYHSSEAQRDAIDAYCQNDYRYADLTLPDYLTKMGLDVEEK